MASKKDQLAALEDQLAALEEQLAAARNEAETEAQKRREAEGHQREWRKRHDALRMREAARVDAERAERYAAADRARREVELKRIEQARDGLVHVDGADSVSFTQEEGQWFVTVERKLNDAEAEALQARLASKPGPKVVPAGRVAWQEHINKALAYSFPQFAVGGVIV